MIFQAETIEISCASDMLLTEEMIDFIKTRYTKLLANELNLFKVSAPVVVPDGTGINDDLSGVEQPISFSIKSLNGQKASIIQSLAKWKRIRLRYYNIEPGKGILTDMRALRPSETLTPIHSVYVDQWDWEKSIRPEERTLRFLKSTVESIYVTIRKIEKELYEKFPVLTLSYLKELHFFISQELLDMFPVLVQSKGKKKQPRNMVQYLLLVSEIISVTESS